MLFRSYIGLELGTVYATLGSKVTVVEATGGVLPGADRDLITPLERRLRDRFEEVLLHTRVTELADEGGHVRARLSGPQFDGVDREFSRALIAVGRRPNSANLGLDRVGVEVDERGFIRVDHVRRTTAQNVFAIGDVDRKSTRLNSSH